MPLPSKTGRTSRSPIRADRPSRRIRIRPLFFLAGAITGIMLLAGFWYLSPVLFPAYTPALYASAELAQFLSSHPDHVLVDVRNKREYDRGHIPGAVHAEYHDADSLKKAAGDKIPITYCTYSAWRGPYAAYQLYKSGYKDVGVLTGGIAAWDEQKGPLETNDPSDSPMIYPHPERDLLFPKRDIAATESASESVYLTMTARQYEFSPKVLRVRKGQHVVLDITSVDVPHGFALPEYHVVEELLPHRTKRISFVADRTGVFSFVCSVYCGSDGHTGHSHMSMVGELIVE